jgi:FAD/FMN-containing dehydrogenase
MGWISRLKYYIDTIISPKKNDREDIFHFTFLLDGIPDWMSMYRRGLFEYQTLLPKEKARTVIPQLIALTHVYGMPAYISAIKVHAKDDFLLSYSLDGYSFAMDIPRRPRKKEKQDKLFRKLNSIVIEAGGIVYLAKDANLTADEFRQMYKNVDRFLAIKKKYDPNNLFESDMYRRIFAI